jgi:hypothetical protein
VLTPNHFIMTLIRVFVIRGVTVGTKEAPGMVAVANLISAEDEFEAASPPSLP